MLNASYNSWRADTAVPAMAPVYRFYNKKNGSHFYTASEAERDSVARQALGDLLARRRGVLGSTPQPGTTHRSTASTTRRTAATSTPRREAEKNNVIANLSATYTYDGAGLQRLRRTGQRAPPVYRFYNKKNGSHFYTASEAEKDSVIANLSATYALDGPAFYVAP